MKIRAYGSKTTVATPPDIVSFGYPRTLGVKPFNRELCRVIHWWQKQTGCRFTGKLLKGYYNGFQDNTIVITVSDVHLLLHELQHARQKLNGVNLRRIYANWHQNYRHKRVTSLSYARLPTEKDAGKISMQFYALWRRESQPDKRAGSAC